MTETVTWTSFHHGNARTLARQTDNPSQGGRSGGIRTHDPQSPRLMRYQTALRSDRGGRRFTSAAHRRQRWSGQQRSQRLQFAQRFGEQGAQAFSLWIHFRSDIDARYQRRRRWRDESGHRQLRLRG
jgi:hypothetical protein